MKYRVCFECELEGLDDISAALAKVSERLRGLPVSLIDIRRAEMSGSVMVPHGTPPPSEADVVCYFKELPLPQGVNSFDEAMRFYNFNKAQGWKRAYEWRALARAWVARIRVDGKAQSFDVDEFFDAAVAASMKNTKGGE